MREGITVEVSAADRTRLEAIAADRNSPQKYVWRARIILATADGHGTAEIMRRTGKSKPCVWRWQERFMREGVSGLLCDKTRKPRKAPLPTATVERVVGLTLGTPPGETTHWTGRATAKLNGVEPLAWLTDVLEWTVSGRTKAHELEQLLPWNWKAERVAAAVNA